MFKGQNAVAQLTVKMSGAARAYISVRTVGDLKTTCVDRLFRDKA